MFPRFCTFKQFQQELGVPADTFLEAVQLGSPSGHWSRRSANSAKTRLGDKQSQWFRALEAYNYFLDTGLIYDPSGEFLNAPSRKARADILWAESLDRAAERLEKFADMHPRSYPKRAAALRQQAAEIRAAIPPSAIV